MRYLIEHWLSDEYWEDSEAMNKLKYGMCGDHFFGNILAPLWISTGCPCCSFFRGLLLGVLVSFPIGGLLF